MDAQRVIQDVRRLVNKFCYEYDQGNVKDRIQFWAKVLDEVEFAMNTRVHPVNKLSPFQIVFNRIPNATLFEDYYKFVPDYNIASYIDDSLMRAYAVNGILEKRDAHYMEQQAQMNERRRTVEPLKRGTIVYRHNPQGIKYHLWEGPFYVVGHDEFCNHGVRRIKDGISAREQVEDQTEPLWYPLDQLKVAKYFSLDDFQHWTYEHKIVSHRDIDGVRYYKFRFANTSPIFDQVMSASELEGNPIISAYEGSLVG